MSDIRDRKSVIAGETPRYALSSDRSSRHPRSRGVPRERKELNATAIESEFPFFFVVAMAPASTPLGIIGNRYFDNYFFFTNKNNTHIFFRKYLNKIFIQTIILLRATFCKNRMPSLQKFSSRIIIVIDNRTR